MQTKRETLPHIKRSLPVHISSSLLILFLFCLFLGKMRLAVLLAIAVSLVAHPLLVSGQTKEVSGIAVRSMSWAGCTLLYAWLLLLAPVCRTLLLACWL